MSGSGREKLRKRLAVSLFSYESRMFRKQNTERIDILLNGVCEFVENIYINLQLIYQLKFSSHFLISENHIYLSKTLWYFSYRYKTNHFHGNNLRSIYELFLLWTGLDLDILDTKMFLTPTPMHFCYFFLYIWHQTIMDWLVLFNSQFTPACKITFSRDLSCIRLSKM